MMVFTGPEDVPEDFGPSAVTIGKFDGVHAGHRAVIDELLSDARASGLASVVVTFDRHPLALLRPELCPEPLTGVEQKLRLLGETGVDATLLLRFDEALARLTPEEFVSHVLVDTIHARSVLVGEDFRFGRGGAGDVAALERLGAEHGFVVRTVGDVLVGPAGRVSSTRIRSLLAAGDVAGAGGLLGHVPTVRGVVVHGAKRGRELGFPTANLSPDSDGLIPADGIYAGWFAVDGDVYPTAISVGNNPTFDGVPQRQVEAYLLDEDIDLYGKVVDVRFVERIRGMVAYEGIGPLIAQMRNDVERVREVLGRS
ncbi:bifunctional riboflavin kinase/FAD synthetase [Labedella populi]|uniref:Riboflavin biosynthesis protein n=1 Tax=Labedella populi TaxID=2498850 RepID=A0A3S3ZWS2_9MICO|nr:bifunctional riboflavin kinase/FAD synthetase [Labedella populi]RWZ55354.1 bifunctional riboflavin kinase/FAD synthetase [Labedella populi]